MRNDSSAKLNSTRQLVYITNVLASILSVLTFILFLILLYLFGWTQTSPLVLGVAVAFLGVIALNKAGFINTGRLFFCLLPVSMTMFITLYSKIAMPGQSYITYFDSRYILLGTTILPGIVFRLSERTPIILCLATTFVSLVLFDPIHNLLHIGFFQNGFTAYSYYYINYVAFISFFALTFGIIVLKWVNEKTEKENIGLLAEKETINIKLTSQNQELHDLNKNLETQNEEILQQQEELSASREMLETANKLIEEQQDKLKEYNAHLEDLLAKKSQDLIRTNEELVQHNNELQQFSFTISHNLRGPVARLLGLTNLLTKPLELDERDKLIELINNSAKDFDGVLKDLSKIIDIRKDLYTVREKIQWEKEWLKVKATLGEELHEQSFSTDFSQGEFVYAVKPMINSILYNLASNAIKYHAPDRPLHVSLQTITDKDLNTYLIFKDNGLGIDLKSYQQDIFKLYKRFHTHVGGKGLGLYLVKKQVESLHGEITVESELNRGTTFKIFLPSPVSVEKQIFFSNEASELAYDANLNVTVIHWKKNVSSEDYRITFTKVLETLKVYNTSAWIADVRNQGHIEDADQLWLLQNIIPEAVKNGLKRLAAVGFHDPSKKAYYERLKSGLAELGIQYRVFSTLDEATQWMASTTTTKPNT
ncbi:MAG: hypothetical protein JNM57_02480 [Cyclobacteriaceae bacterium]|nr:hypothetical protein [Cyclobacteriaceae bacterium]